MRLYKEFELISFRYQLRLGTVLISLEPLGDKWGQYNPRGRHIRLNEDLPRQYPWGIVVEVLKHEMAHLLVAEGRWSPEKPHGLAFQDSCAKLGVAKWARQGSGELPKKIPLWSDQNLDDEQDRLLRKAEKLLALAESSSEHEAALAMERVRQLYAKYNLENIRLKKEDDYVYCTVTRKKQRIDSAESLIYSILIEFFFVRVVTLHIYDPLTFETYRGAEFLGKQNNVKLAEYVYHFLWNQAEIRSKDFKKTKKGGGSKRAYRLGLLHGFYDKLKEQSKELERSLKSDGFETGDVTALITLSDKALKEYVSQRFPSLTTRASNSGSNLDPHSFNAGHSEGKKLNLHKGVDKSADQFGGLLS